jgi:RES domain-containing protein
MVRRNTEGGRTHEWVFRHCHPDHTNLADTLAASRDHDDRGRFHIRGRFGAVYIACDQDTALAELDHKASLVGLARADLLPRYLLTLELHVTRVLDLTNEATRRAWGLTEADLRDNDYTRCREVAEAARDDGYEAILYPSARGESENYAVFLDRLKPGSTLREVDRSLI